MLNCAECNKQISVTARVCPHCGSKKQFKGYKFKRKDLIAMGVTMPEDFYNFNKCGGVVSNFYVKAIKYAFITYLIYFVYVIVQG